MVRVDRGQSLLRAWWGDLRSRYLTAPRVTGFLVVFLCLPLFMNTFGSYKQAIPRLVPFCWDVRFSEWDRGLHGGTDPWQWLQPLVGQPLVTAAINCCYTIWFFIMFAVVLWQAWGRDRTLRMQFMLS